MKISLRQIGRNGFDVLLNDKEPWLVDVLKNIFQEAAISWTSIRGQVHLDNLEGNVNLSGRIEFDHSPLCARCGEELQRHEKVTLSANLIPFKGIAGEKAPREEEEKELTADDLNFAFYEGEEIDIAPIVNDEIALALPYNYYCEETKACAARQKNLPAFNDSGDVRFAALKEFANKKPI